MCRLPSLLLLLLLFVVGSVISTNVADLYKKELREQEIRHAEAVEQAFEDENQRLYDTCYEEIQDFIRDRKIIGDGVTYLGIKTCFTKNSTILDNILGRLRGDGWNVDKKRIHVIYYRSSEYHGYYGFRCQGGFQQSHGKERYLTNDIIYEVKYQEERLMGDYFHSFSSFMCNAFSPPIHIPLTLGGSTTNRVSCPCNIWTVAFDTR